MRRTVTRGLQVAMVAGTLTACATAPRGPTSAGASLELLRHDPWRRALQEVLETRRRGEPVTVRNGLSGRIVVLGTYRRRDGRWCRRFRVEIAGERPRIGFACRDDRGVWHLRPDPFARGV